MTKVTVSMKYVFSLAFLFSLIITACAGSSEMQPEEFQSLPSYGEFPTLPPETEVYNEVDEMPGLERSDSNAEALSRVNEQIVQHIFRTGFDRTVQMEYVVTPGGRAKNIELEESTGNEELDLALKQAVYLMRFKPGMLNGERVYTRFGHAVDFSSWSRQ